MQEAIETMWARKLGLSRTDSALLAEPPPVGAPRSFASLRPSFYGPRSEALDTRCTQRRPWADRQRHASGESGITWREWLVVPADQGVAQCRRPCPARFELRTSASVPNLVSTIAAWF